MAFDFSKYRRDFDTAFFTDNSAIRFGSEEHKDFWVFCEKLYKLKSRTLAGRSRSKGDLNPNHLVCVECIASSSGRKWVVEDAITRMPFRDPDSSKPPVPVERLKEFAEIIAKFLDFMQKEKFRKLRKLREAQKNLPIAEHESDIVNYVKNFPVVLIAGDTGCGKSTQVPQYLLKAGFSRIACTQPRRIACISLCQRVAYETLNQYGDEVGYQVRFERAKTKATRIVFLTEGLLLRQIVGDPTLTQYDVIVLDEVHERHLQGDFLLGILKCLMYKRKDLKIVLMSATINSEMFTDYFFNLTPIVQVPGRLYPIEVVYWPVVSEEKAGRISPSPYIRILHMIDEKYPAEERGDVLIFLSGMAEITAIADAAKEYAQKTNRWIILQLHSSLSIEEQDRAFDIAPDGVRKCVISTNIAETSVTIDGIRFVVDSGKVKEMTFDPTTRTEKLKECMISRASAEQRKGRAGRTGPGICYRLYTREEFESMTDFSAPEIMRTSLDSLVLQMVSMGVKEPLSFPFIQKPDSSRLKLAMESLISHGAVEPNGTVTTVGGLLAMLPVDIMVGKLLINGCVFERLDKVLSIASVLTVQNPLTNKSYRDPDCVSARKALMSDQGDPFMLLNMYSAWLAEKNKTGTGSSSRERSSTTRSWCKRRGIEEQRMYEVTKMRDQFMQIVKESEFLDQAAPKQETAAQRRIRIGERSMLHQWMREFKRKRGLGGEGRKRKVLKARDGEVASDDEETSGKSGNIHEAKDVEFRMRRNAAEIKNIIEHDKVDSFQDMVFMKAILTASIYPQWAIADPHNNYKAGTEQMYHTKDKPFVTLHPMGMLANNPEVLRVGSCEPTVAGFPPGSQISNKHELLLYLSMMETTRPFLMNTARIPAAQSLFLFALNTDVDHNFSRYVFDGWLEVRFTNPLEGMQLLIVASEVRVRWKKLLDLKIMSAGRNNVNRKEYSRNEKIFVNGLVQIYLNDSTYSLRRLLAADAKTMYYGHDGTSSSSHLPEMPDDLNEPEFDSIKGGWKLSDHVTYDCLTYDALSSALPEDGLLCPCCDDFNEDHPYLMYRHIEYCCKERIDQTDLDLGERTRRSGSSDSDEDGTSSATALLRKRKFQGGERKDV
ncbi:unnamed protein product [Notodromas monacha]|uniref:RNA helicase n=1 Tax=Notodromas monacha TaxID=399045 RepID=A0A7R9GG66_9CRUS|nr:unnamed protein product [Notodromas monacha]CAG0919646.1 unnamed protein product [Notodromas monacha]